MTTKLKKLSLVTSYSFALRSRIDVRPKVSVMAFESERSASQVHAGVRLAVLCKAHDSQASSVAAVVRSLTPIGVATICNSR